MLKSSIIALFVLALSAQAGGAQQPGEAAFGAIAGIVRMLDADPATDWSRVNVEALRRHLVDMHEVTVNANVAQTNTTQGFQADVTGTGRTVAAIRRMVRGHAHTTATDNRYGVEITEITGGVRIRVSASQGDVTAITRLQGLGFIGWLALGDHHAPHHVMLARGGAAH